MTLDPTSPSREQENKLICVYAIALFITSGTPNTFREKTVKKDKGKTFFEIKTVSIVARSNTRGYC